MSSGLHVGGEGFGPGQILQNGKNGQIDTPIILKMTIYLVFHCHTLVQEPKFSGFAQFQVTS
eukprot:403347168